MFDFFRSLAQRPARKNTTRRAMFHPSIEMLEDRLVPATLGPEFSPPAMTAGHQTNPDVTSGRDGLYVVVWQHRHNSTTHDIYARIIDTTGPKPATKDILVAGSSRDEIDPAVAMDNKGNFAVVWSYKHSGNNFNKPAAQFDSTGARRNGGNFTVAGQSFSETDPDVAVSGHGHMVITFHRRDHAYARMYNDNRAFVREISVSTTGKKERDTKVARSADGRFSITYVINTSQFETTVYARRFSAAGNLLQRRRFAVSNSQNPSPSISMNHRGDTLIGWHRELGTPFFDGLTYVYARMWYYTGRVGPFRLIDIAFSTDSSAGPNDWLTKPHITLRTDGHDDQFLVTYNLFEEDLGTGSVNSQARFVVFDYSQNQALDSGVFDTDGVVAVAAWNRNMNEALIVWNEATDVKAKKVTI